jgi:hypothetical protein
MTRSKVEFATILAGLRGRGEDPQKLAQDMTLRRLCYEIEKAESEAEARAPPTPAPKKTAKAPKSLWDRITLENSDDD